MRVQAEGQEKALRKQKNQGQRASQENAAHHLIENPRLLQRKQTVHLHLAKQMHLNWSPLGFMSDLSTNKLETRFPPDVWQAFLSALLLQDVHRSFG